VTHHRQRNFLPGSGWLYVKIFCTPETSGRILANVMMPVIRKNSKSIKTWFFIRYFENGHHLRLRILSDEKRTGVILAALKKQLEHTGNDKVIRNYQADVYRREMERYGPGMIGKIETFFCAGSELVIRYTVLLEQGKTSLSDVQLGLITAYSLIKWFLKDSTLIIDFIKLRTARFAQEFAADKKIKMDLDQRYRLKKTEIEHLLTGQLAGKTLITAFNALYDRTMEITDILKDNPLYEKQKLLADLVHMQLNRTFRIKQRQQEFMVYYFLEKYAISIKARAQKSTHLV
jgi:thiopeptide-type bacteriocin biosynthesis protein